MASVHWSYSKHEDFSKQLLRSLSSEERHCLATFLHRILFSDHFCYVFFGNKPLAFTSFPKTESMNLTFDNLSEENSKCEIGFSIFRKHLHLFSSKKFFIRICDDPAYTVLIAINKKEFIKKFDEHKEDFHEILGIKNGEDLLRQMLEDEDIGEALGNHEALLGILLGYGRNNSWLFHNRKTMQHTMRKFNLSQKKQELLNQQISKINQVLKPFSSQRNENSSLIRQLPRLPGFMADSTSSETLELKRRYNKDQKKMAKLFARQGFVVPTLQKLNEE